MVRDRTAVTQDGDAVADMRSFEGIPRFHTDPGAPADALLRQAEEAAAVRAQLSETTGEAASDDGLITSVVGARGLQELRLDPRAMRMPSEDLAKAIIDVTAQAREDMERRRLERARELGLAQERPGLDQSLAKLAELRSLIAESQGDARRVFERFQAQTER